MTARVTDLNGFYTVPNNPLSRPGVFPYTKKSTGYPGWEADPAGIVMVWRPEEELADPQVADSFKLAPWVDDHAMLGNPELDASLTPAEKKGVHGTIGEQVFYDRAAKKLVGNLRIWSSSLADAIDAGKKELSCGFRCVYEFKSGEFEGQRYDAIQRTIRGNHLASVPMGRMGPEVAVLDHLTFAFDADEIRGLPMKVTRRAVTAKKLGIAEDALPAHFGITGADALAAFKVAMDAEEDAPEGDGEGSGGGMTIEEIVDVVKEAAGPLGELNDALMTMAGAPPADSEDPNAMTDDDMEPVLDAQGQQVMENGKPKMQKKAAVQTDAMGETAPAIGIAAMDAAISGFDAISKSAHAALKGRAAPAQLTAMDAAVSKAKAARAKVKVQKKVKPMTKVADNSEMRAALDGLATAVKAVPTAKSIMADIASRDTLARRVSPFTGTFACDAMDVREVAQYALKKFGVAAIDGQEVSQVEAYLHGRTPTNDAKPASAFGMDAAPAGKPASYVNDFVAGRATASV